jgi:hypothetical protein
LLVFGRYGKLTNNLMQVRNALEVASRTGRTLIVPESISLVLAPMLPPDGVTFPWRPVSSSELIPISACFRMQGRDANWASRLPDFISLACSVCAEIGSIEQLISAARAESGNIYIPSDSSFNMVSLPGWDSSLEPKASFRHQSLVSPNVLVAAHASFNSIFASNDTVLCAHVRLGDYVNQAVSSLRLLGTFANQIRAAASRLHATRLLLLTDGSGAQVSALSISVGIPTVHGCPSSDAINCAVPAFVTHDRDNFVAAREQSMCALADGFIGSQTLSTFSGFIQVFNCVICGYTNALLLPFTTECGRRFSSLSVLMLLWGL